MGAHSAPLPWAWVLVQAASAKAVMRPSRSGLAPLMLQCALLLMSSGMQPGSVQVAEAGGGGGSISGSSTSVGLWLHGPGGGEDTPTCPGTLGALQLWGPAQCWCRRLGSLSKW